MKADPSECDPNPNRSKTCVVSDTIARRSTKERIVEKSMVTSLLFVF